MKTKQGDVVSYLLALFQSVVLLVAWPSGKKGCKGVDFTKVSLQNMMDPDYRRKLTEGNIGVVQGEASGGIGSIDIDDDQGADEFLALNPDLKETLRSRGARGCNVWFYPEADVPASCNLKRDGQEWGEWRFNGREMPEAKELDIIVRSDDGTCMRYPGGKFRCFQKLVNLIPPHRVYIETHLGGGAVLRNKAPAEINIGIDRDPSVIGRFMSQFGSSYLFIVQAAEDFLKGYCFQGDEFVYVDPPYWPSSRRSTRSPYRFRYTEAEHLKLLRTLHRLPCAVMISGYSSAEYDLELAGWEKRSFAGTSHVGRRKEIVWLNFKPGVVHDVRYLGVSFRERQGIRRKRERWTARFGREPLPVQQAILSDLVTVFRRRVPTSIAAS